MGTGAGAWGRARGRAHGMGKGTGTGMGQGHGKLVRKLAGREVSREVSRDKQRVQSSRTAHGKRISLVANIKRRSRRNTGPGGTKLHEFPSQGLHGHT